MKSLDELDKLREKLQAEMRIREGQPDTRVTVAMGTCGIAAGAREVVTALLEEMKKRNVKGVTITQTGCAGLCHYEPLVEVEVPGGERVTYVHVDGDKAREIVLEHLVNGQIIKEWTILKK
ncbi:(2Fe-2S) ferredoxin domain-containing protein [Desulfotomaculum copahuensis]|uniref:NADH dehydrogenase n=1 Tax=Desulfotomaculum copahuensis TaxID=1838280 RepID=A0A1B7LHI7_9FIRM|nr:(2Fe-2S) ferredoxin domain-containing protein [Desulfotomaculum copahuensis]OAT85716.1 NADH dehydrogenase [Desulfotomaculum copahuensis]